MNLQMPTQPRSQEMLGYRFGSRGAYTGHKRTLRQRSKSARIRLFHRLTCLWVLSRVWLREIRTCFRRITSLRALHTILSTGIEIGPTFQEYEDGMSGLCRQTLACNADMQRLNDMRPALGLLDLQLYIDGWKRGAEWAISEQRTPGSDSRRRQAD